MELDYIKNPDALPEKNGSAVKIYDEDDPELKGSTDESVDPWELPEFTPVLVKWEDLTTLGKVKRVLWDYSFRQIVLIGLLYLFICSLSFLSDAFRLLGGKEAGEVLANNAILSNPVAGLMVGVLVTVLVQSSSTSTSLVVAMVASEILDVRTAIPVIMGANIGTSVTNTIVAFGQIARRDEFRRAFAGATVHDAFNWLSVLILLPLEAASGYLFHLSKALIAGIPDDDDTVYDTKFDILKVITKPFTSRIVQIDKKVIENIAKNSSFVPGPTSLVKYDKEHIFTGADQHGWTDVTVGVCVLVIALVTLTVCLFGIVKILHETLKGTIAILIRKIVHASFPGKVGEYLTGYIVILFGAIATIIVQSSSIFTSTLTPLVGVGVISLERMFPFTLGSNIGTTATGILAALASKGKVKLSLQVAICHLFFNISGILIWYPVPFMRKGPIGLAKKLGDITVKYRWFAILYLICMFFLFPALVFALSLASWIALAAVLIPIAVLVICISIINLLQSKRPQSLPTKLQNWDFLPAFMHSLKPYDKVFTFCCRCRQCKKDNYIT